MDQFNHKIVNQISALTLTKNAKLLEETIKFLKWHKYLFFRVSTPNAQHWCIIKNGFTLDQTFSSRPNAVSFALDQIQQ